MRDDIALQLPANLSRRRFVQGLAVGGALLGLGGRSAWAFNSGSQPQELRGTEFHLEISEIPVNFTGQPRMATAINGQIPGPTLRWREGDTVTIHVTNRMNHTTSIHWHGIILPNAMDGVPGLTFNGIAPGETFTYRFPVQQSGTYWYHSHSGFQEQTGLYAPLVIEPRAAAPYSADRDYVVMLTDWTDEDPNRVFANLKKGDSYYNYVKPTLADFLNEARQKGWSAAWQERAMWDAMRMSPRDLVDVSGATYTYLLNGTTPAGNWTGLFRKGERIRLRFINGSSMSYFDVRIPGLSMTVVAADGQNVHPVTVDEFRMAVAETYDVIVQPQDDSPYTIFAQSMDRSGYARGTLAPQMGLAAEVPPMDPVPTLTMADMGMGMHDMGAMNEMPGMSMPASAAAASSTMATGAAPAKDDAMAMGDNMAGMDMSGMAASPQASAAPEHSHMAHEHTGHAGHTAAPANPHAGHNMDGLAGMDMSSDSMANGSDMQGMNMASQRKPDTMEVTHHPVTENGPGVDMQASVVSTRLDDPGVGLRHNGRRVLTYADLHSLDGSQDLREPSRTIELHLTGNMRRYMWSFDGVEYADAQPIRLQYGERVRFVLINDTMMEHPIHLHGMWSELENQDGGFQVRKHTISVKPGQSLSYRVLADARGRWAYHCHLLYHMMGGMFREVNVA